MNRRGFFGMLAGLFGGLMLPKQPLSAGLGMPSKKYTVDFTSPAVMRREIGRDVDMDCYGRTILHVRGTFHWEGDMPLLPWPDTAPGFHLAYRSVRIIATGAAIWETKEQECLPPSRTRSM